ncbi:uncharacterized protein TNCV_909691 [Trichonephila clavipes]|nr:uncharacterized protein TNCV_909691 [Trichonephila clavipes]
MYQSCAAWGTLNIRRSISSIEWLVVGEHKWKAPDTHRLFFHKFGMELSQFVLSPALCGERQIYIQKNLKFIACFCNYVIKVFKIQWCAKIKDEVEKLAHQLNKEAERTKRPIRRLSKVMYGSTCADMQVDVMGECLSSIKHVVGEQLSGGSVVVVHEEPHPQMTGTLSYRPEETGGRQRERIARHTTQATGRPISRFTVARRLHGGGLFARRPVRCVPLTPAHRRRRSLWCREHRN